MYCGRTFAACDLPHVLQWRASGACGCLSRSRQSDIVLSQGSYLMDWESRRVRLIEDICAIDRENVSHVKRRIDTLTGDLGAASVWVWKRPELLHNSLSVESIQVHDRR